VIRLLTVVPAVGAVLLVWISISNTPTNLRVVVAAQAANQAASPPNAAAPNVATPTPVADKGRDTFITNCSFCHGSDARGGAEGGPDLTRSALVMGDMTGQQLIAFLKVGRPPRMPPFNLPDSQVTEIMAFLRSQIEANANGHGGDPKAILVGDAKQGEAYFNGAGGCTRCHSVTGNLKGIGSKYDAIVLQGRIVLPRAQGSYPGFSWNVEPHAGDAPRRVTVTQSSGQTIEGQIVTISDYDVSLRDANGALHTFTRDGDVPKVDIHDPLQAHLDMLPKLTDKNMHDLTAYLVTVK
jgi:cytochrome c oxidase cbb3-type subunit III